MFDKDGVLVDFEKTWVQVLVDLAGELGRGDRQRTNQLLQLAGYDFVNNTFGSGSVWAAGTTDDLVDVWMTDEKRLSARQLTKLIDQKCEQCDAVPLFPLTDYHRMFSDFQTKGYKLGIATNDLHASATKTMRNFGLTEYLEIIIGYDSVENAKPHADQFLLFCKTCSLTPDQVVMVGDNTHDMEMAEAAEAGARIGVLTGNSSRKELEAHSDHILETVMDLPQMLASLAD